MYGINQTQHLGNLTRDPELRYTPSGKAVARISIACNYPIKKDDEWTQGVDFITYIAWERTAEIAGEHLRKGSKVFIEGRVKPRKYEKDGSMVYTTDLVVTTLRLVDSRSKDDAQDNTAAKPSAVKNDAPKKRAAKKNAPPVVPEDSAVIPDDDIPF